MKASDIFADSRGPRIILCPNMARWLGDRKAALFLAHLVYWTDKSTDGWVFRTSDQIEAETTLTYREQRPARQRLQELGFLEENYDRRNHRKYYRLKLEVVRESWRGFCSNADDVYELTSGQVPPDHSSVPEMTAGQVPPDSLSDRIYKKNQKKIQKKIQEAPETPFRRPFTPEVVKKVTDRVLQKKNNQRVTTLGLATHFLNLTKEIRNVIAPTPTKKDAALIKSVIIKKCTNPMLYVTMCVTHWDELRKRITWRNGTSKLDKHPSIEEICLSFTAIYQEFMGGEFDNRAVPPIPSKTTVIDDKTGLEKTYA